LALVVSTQKGGDVTTESGWKTISAMEEETGLTTEQIHAGIKDDTFEARVRSKRDPGGDPGQLMVRRAFPKV
jgi:hypothetical protein